MVEVKAEWELERMKSVTALIKLNEANILKSNKYSANYGAKHAEKGSQHLIYSIKFKLPFI